MGNFAKYKIDDCEVEVTPYKSTYVQNGSLFVSLIAWGEDGPEPFMDVTTNISDAEFRAHGTYQYVQTGNVYGINLVEFLESNGLAENIDVCAVSGFNTYVLMDFSGSIETIPELDELLPD